jgi:hypothetical protein
MDEEVNQPQAAVKLTFPDLVKVIFTDFVGFAQSRLTSQPPPLMFIAVWLIGMDTVAGGIELGYIAGEQYAVDNWLFAWLRIIVGGAAVGIFRYWLVGSLFHVVVIGAGGKGHAWTSRYILLYALIPATICNLSIKILQMLLYQNEYFAGQRNELIEGLFGMAMMVAYVFTLVLCYRGMRELQQTDRTRSIVILAALSIGSIILTIISLGL